MNRMVFRSSLVPWYTVCEAENPWLERAVPYLKQVQLFGIFRGGRGLALIIHRTAHFRSGYVLHVRHADH